MCKATLRLCLLGANLICVLTAYLAFGFQVHLYYFTNWALWITIWSIGLTMVNKHWLVSQLCFELAFIIDLFVVVVHLLMMFTGELDQFKKSKIQLYHMYAVHIVPFSSVLVNKCISNQSLNQNHFMILPVISISYAYVNYKGV